MHPATLSKTWFCFLRCLQLLYSTNNCSLTVSGTERGVCGLRSEETLLHWGKSSSLRREGERWVMGRRAHTAFTSAWHPSIRRRNRSASEPQPTKADGLVGDPQLTTIKGHCARVRVWASERRPRFALLTLCPIIKGRRWEQHCGSWDLRLPFQTQRGHIKDGGPLGEHRDTRSHTHCIIKNAMTCVHTCITCTKTLRGKN